MYEVIIAKDAESGYFYVHDSDIIGLQACAPTFDGLLEVIDDVAAELIAANHKPRPAIWSHILAAFRSEPPKPRIHLNYTQELAAA